MRTVLYAAAMLAILPGCVDPALSTSTQDVIHGSLTPAGKYPATGALIAEYQGQQIVFCTGTLISSTAVATAAHCLIPPPDVTNFSPYFTFALDGNNAPFSQLLPSAAFHYHPQYNNNVEPPGTISHTYDVGIVLLQHPVTNVQPAFFPTAAEAATMTAGMSIEITGYGQTVAADQNSGGVKYDATTTLTVVGAYEIGVGAAGAPQNCHGDSGGPAYMHVGSGLRMIGTVSRGNTGGEDTCDKGGIDTRIDAYRDWFASYTTLPDPPVEPPPGGGDGSGSGSGSGTGSGSGSGSGSDPGGEPEHGSAFGGCSTGGGAVTPLVALGLIACARRRRRTATRPA